VPTSDELTDFVKEALLRGIPPAQVEDVLLRAGWSRPQVRTALAGYAAIDFPLPVPRPRPYLSPRDAFLYLVLFSTLYVSAWNLGSLAFQIINRLFPDPAVVDRAPYVRDAMRWSVASLVAAFPVFLYLQWSIERAVRLDPAKRDSKVRRWLTYLTLFVAACALIGDLTTLVYYFLGGELTTRFLLKVTTIAAIAGTCFWYYLSDLRSEEVEAKA
jgi:Domain of unknown function (DUF5671)